jgi:hypothetical protein
MKSEVNKFSLCGLNCGKCPSFIAYKNNDNELRVETAERWRIEFNQPNLKPEDINCLGCLSLKEPIYEHCKVCGVRKCGMERGVKNCGECAEYDGCKIVASLHKAIPEGKAVCDKFAKELNSPNQIPGNQH